MNLVPAIQYVDAQKNEQEAIETLAILRGDDDFLGGRVLPAVGDRPWRIQAFYTDTTFEGWLPDGCRHVGVPSYLLK